MYDSEVKEILDKFDLPQEYSKLLLQIGTQTRGVGGKTFRPFLAAVASVIGEIERIAQERALALHEKKLSHVLSLDERGLAAVTFMQVIRRELESSMEARYVPLWTARLTEAYLAGKPLEEEPPVK